MAPGQHCQRRVQAVAPHPLHEQVRFIVPSPRHPKLTQAAERGQAVRASLEVLYQRLALGDAVKDRCAMRDRLGRRDGYRAAHSPRCAHLALHLCYVFFSSSLESCSLAEDCFCARPCSSFSRSRRTPSATLSPKEGRRFCSSLPSNWASSLLGSDSSFPRWICFAIMPPTSILISA